MAKIKGGKSAGGKKKGGKKGGKKDDKSSKKQKALEDIRNIAKRNADIWDARVSLSQKIVEQSRERMKTLTEENSAMQDILRKSERNTVEVIQYLKTIDEEKDEKLSELEDKIKTDEAKFKRQLDEVVMESAVKMQELLDELVKKDTELEENREKLSNFKEYEHRTLKLQKEIDELNFIIHKMKQDHAEILDQLERKFFEEKMLINYQNINKIKELSHKAHIQAVENLNQAMERTFIENVDLKKSINQHIEASNKMKKILVELNQNEKHLKEDTKIAGMTVTKTLTDLQKCQHSLKKKNEQISILERTLKRVLNDSICVKCGEKVSL